MERMHNGAPYSRRLNARNESEALEDVVRGPLVLRIFLPAKYPLDLPEPELRQHKNGGDGDGRLHFLLSAVQCVRGQCIREESNPLDGTPHLDQPDLEDARPTRPGWPPSSS
jgi:hypothetical protein